MNATDLIGKLDALAARGIAVAVSSSGTLQVRPAALLTADDREWLRAHAGVVMAHLESIAVSPRAALSGNEWWDSAVALALMSETDSLVAESGVPGTDPIIRAAAGRGVEAHRLRDARGVRDACRTIRERVERLTQTPPERD